MYFNTSSVNLKENKRNLQIIRKSYTYVSYKTVELSIGSRPRRRKPYKQSIICPKRQRNGAVFRVNQNLVQWQVWHDKGPSQLKGRNPQAKANYAVPRRQW